MKIEEIERWWWWGGGGVIRFLTIHVYAYLSKIETQMIYKGDNIRRPAYHTSN